MKLKKYAKGGKIKDPRQDSYYTPTSSDNKKINNLKTESKIISDKEADLLKEKELERKNKAFLEEYNKQYPERKGIKFPQKNEGAITQNNDYSPYNPLFSPYFTPNLGNQNDQKTFEAQQYLGKDNATNMAFNALSIVPANNILNIINPNNIPVFNETYKINPFANKLNNPNSYYRIAGKESLDDALSSGVVRSKPPVTNTQGSINLGSRPTSFPSFDKGKVDFSYASKNADNVIYESKIPMFKRGDLNPVTNKPITGRHWAYRPIDTQTGQTINEIPLEQINMYSSTPHWLNGYTEIPKKEFKNGGQNKPIITNDPRINTEKKGVLDKIDDVMSAPQRGLTYLLTGKYQNPSEALGIKNKWGALAADLILDPTNLLGVGIASKLSKGAKVIDVLEDGTKVVRELSKLDKPFDIVNGGQKYVKNIYDVEHNAQLSAKAANNTNDYLKYNKFEKWSEVVQNEEKIRRGQLAGLGIAGINDLLIQDDRFKGQQMYNSDSNAPKNRVSFKRQLSQIRNERIKEQPIQIDNIPPNLLPTYQPENTIQTIPFTKGSYFTRPRQSQEAGQGKTDMFDKKTGKFMGTYADGGKTNPPIITNNQEEEFSFQREAIVRMNPLVRAYPTQNDNNNLQSVPEGVDRYLQNKAKSNRNFTDVLTERYNFPYAPYAVQKNSVFRKEGHEDPYTDVVYNAFGNEYSNFPEKERNMLADRANELGYGVKNSNFDKKTGKLMGTYADGGFSERKSKSGRVFKYKSYKI